MALEGDSVSGPSESAEKRYKVMLLDLWESIRSLEAKVLAQYLFIAPMLDEGKSPQNITVSEAELLNMNELLALSITMWRELLPKVHGTSVENDFKAFEPYNSEPTSYIKDTSKIFELTQTLRNTLEVLEITKFEKEVR